MPDTRHHRGAHPEDAALFAPERVPALRDAFADLCWLLDRDYPLNASLALTGNRRSLAQRQRLALSRCACTAGQLASRDRKRLKPGDLAGRELWIDGYNVLITLEAALSGGIVLAGRDGAYRDMASLHGTYREVSETTRAIELVGTACIRWGVSRCRWLLDQPIGNSGRLRAQLLGIAEANDWVWDAELAYSPDRALSAAIHAVATSDSFVLDRCACWFNATREIVSADLPGARVIELSG